MFLTQRRLQRMSSFWTPAYRVNIGRICIYPVIIATVPAIKMNLDNKKKLTGQVRSKNSYSKSSVYSNHFHSLLIYIVHLIPNTVFQLFKLYHSHSEKRCIFDLSSNYLTINKCLAKGNFGAILLHIYHAFLNTMGNLSI